MSKTYTKSQVDRMSNAKLTEILEERGEEIPTDASNAKLASLILAGQQSEPEDAEGDGAAAEVEPAMPEKAAKPASNALAGFTNIQNAAGDATLTWEKKLPYGRARALQLKEDSGWSAALRERTLALAEACSYEFLDRQSKVPNTENLPEFSENCILEVTVRIIPA